MHECLLHNDRDNHPERPRRIRWLAKEARTIIRQANSAPVSDSVVPLTVEQLSPGLLTNPAFLNAALATAASYMDKDVATWFLSSVDEPTDGEAAVAWRHFDVWRAFREADATGGTRPLVTPAMAEHLRLHDETCRTVGTSQAIAASIAMVQRAVRVLATPDLPSIVFAATRPPGHHASCSRSPYGFCFVNNALVAIDEAKKVGLAQRTLVLDIDLHAGNGTIEHMLARKRERREAGLAEEDEAIWYWSAHAGGEFPQDMSNVAAWEAPYFLRPIDMTKSLAGRRTDFLTSLAALSACLHKFAPDFFVISAGFDSHEAEQLLDGGLGLRNVDFRDIGSTVARWSRLFGQSSPDQVAPILVVLEGGYAQDGIRGGFRSLLEGLSGVVQQP